MRENSEPIINRRTIWAMLLLAGFVASGSGCSKKDEVKCPDPEPVSKKAKSDKTRDPLTALSVGSSSPNADWCRACVMGPKGWASCQTVYAQSKDESRDAVKARSRLKACDDAGFEKGQCPDKAVLGITCKGDKAPAANKDAAKAMQAVFFKGKDIKPELTGEAEKSAEQKSDKADAQQPVEEKK